LADGGEILLTRENAAALTDSKEFRFVEDDTVELRGLPDEHRLGMVAA